MAGLSGNEYSTIRHQVQSLLEWLEGKRDSALRSAVHYPSTSAKRRGEADAYDDAADGVRKMLATFPK